MFIIAMFVEELRKYSETELPIVAMYKDLGKAAFLLLLRDESIYDLKSVLPQIPYDQAEILAIFGKVCRRI